MTAHPANRLFWLKFDLVDVVTLTAVVAVEAWIIQANPESWPEWTTLAVLPFMIGLGVGMLSSSRSQLFLAPLLAAIIAPVPWSLVVAFLGPDTGSSPWLDFVVTWALFSVIVLFFGGLAALAGSALGSFLRSRKQARG